jgi:hypothetical protein
MLLSLEQSVDEKVAQYLDVRFKSEVERWALAENATIPDLVLKANNIFNAVSGPGRPRPTGWESLLQPPERRDLLVQYLAAVKKKAGTDLKLLPAP